VVGGVGTTKPIEKPLVHGAHLVKAPGYSERFSEILKILGSHGGIYIPEEINIGSDKGERTWAFKEGLTDRFSQAWREAGPIAACILKRSSPIHVDIVMGKSPLHFEPFVIHVERGYLQDSGRLTEFLDVMKELYSVLHPTYGLVETPEMVKLLESQGGKMSLGINLKRALPDIYWANFLGREYVQMFGRANIESTPCYRVEMLSDGGALLLLTPSIFDYDFDPEGFDRARLVVKQHLGLDAFDTGDQDFRGRVPPFIFSSQAKIASVHSDWLSTINRNEWKE
jgi:hypothetical protein